MYHNPGEDFSEKLHNRENDLADSERISKNPPNLTALQMEKSAMVYIALFGILGCGAYHGKRGTNGTQGTYQSA